MKITKVYYKELRSKKVDGKFSNVEIGAEVSINAYGQNPTSANPIGLESPDHALMLAKDYVRRKLEIENLEEPKTTKDKLIKVRRDIKKVIENINNDIPINF